MLRKKKLLLNTFSSLLFQITTIICGFILPHLILHNFGSNVNGLVNSITQFLQIIAFLELGVGAVVQSSLYKPLVDTDNTKISQIITSAGKFFKRIAQVLLIYIILLMVFFPFIVVKEFSWIYTATLIFAMSISSFAQYYFGIVDRLLLTADQRGYIQYTAQMLTLIVNTVACAVLISLGSGIHFVKLSTSLIYLVRPVFLRYYVNKKYSIDRKASYSVEPIKQKWNGVAQHVAAVVLDSTDAIVLTLFSTLANVSVYSIYYLVVSGVKQLFSSTINGVQALLGELWAEDDRAGLRKLFSQVEWGIHTGTVLIWGCTSILIVPFVKVFTNGISDTNYIVPTFAILISLANAMYCLRMPYNIMILAAGHYKQTQNNYIIATFLNIVISIVTVKFLGLIGVAVGTLVAMLYQTIWMANYSSKHLLEWSYHTLFKQFFVDIITAIIGYILTSTFQLVTPSGYLSWFLLAIKVAVIWIIVVVCINTIFYRDKIVSVKNRILKK